ncbi:Rossmann-like domain-containing protein [Methanococcus sp. CF]
MIDFKSELERIATQNNLLDETIEIKPVNVNLESKTIDDYPLMQGKEFLLRAFFKGDVGDAFTNNLVEFNGKISEVIASGSNQMMIAALNSVMKHLKMVEKSEHCIKGEPEVCAKDLSDFLIKELGKDIKIGVIGYHPAIIRQMVTTFGKDNVIASDMDLDTIGRIKQGIVIMHGSMNEHLIENSDIVLSTGSTAANGSLEEILDYTKKYDKRIIFYGTTVACAAKMLNLERFCALGK